MNIAKELRGEIERRGLSVTAVSEGADLPFTTVSAFLRGVQEIGADKASKIAEFLGFGFSISNLRRKEMSDYLAVVKDAEERDIPTDDETMEMVAEFAANIKYLEDHVGGWNDWNEDDAEMASNLRANLEWLADNNYENWSEDDAEMADGLVRNIEWLNDNGWKNWSEDDASEVAGFVQDLNVLQEMGEEATPDRIQEVAEFVANLQTKKRRRG